MNPMAYIRTAEIALDVAPAPDAAFAAAATGAPALSTIDLANLPEAVVTGTTLLDLSQVQSPDVKAGISLAMLFASRVATAKHPITDDAWLAEYQKSLNALGFAVGATSVVTSRFKKTGLTVHEAIIPFLTLALGGVAAAPTIILKLLESMKSMSPGEPWITAFERQTLRFDVREMHFAFAVPNATQTEIRYAVARLSLDHSKTQVLFFKLTDTQASYESATTTMSVSNSLMAVSEADLKERLEKLIKSYIWDVPIE